MQIESFDDLLKDPNKFGVPTFEQFRKNPKLFRVDPEEAFICAENGSTIFKKDISYRFFLDSYECKNLEEVQRIAQAEGYNFKDLDIKPEIRKLPGGKAEFIVKFYNKPKSLVIT